MFAERDAASPAAGVPRFLAHVLSRYAARSGARLTTISEGWIWALERSDHRIVVFGYDLGLNTATTEKLCRDKAATAALLARDGLRTPPCRLLLHPGFAAIRAPEEVSRDLGAGFASFGGDVVIKPNEGACGRGVARARSVAAAEEAAARLFALEQNALIQPFIPAERELRVYLLGSRVELAVEKDRGARTNGAWTGNMSLGARGRRVAVDANIATFTAAVAVALDLRFGSLDILVDAKGPMILEANNGVMLESFSRLGADEARLAEDLYGRALDLRFAQAGD